jgi:RNA-directed DNA polymerase
VHTSFVDTPLHADVMPSCRSLAPDPGHQHGSQGHTMAQRMRAKLREINLALKRRRHLPLDVQGAWLASVVRGYYAYHAVPTNSQTMSRFRFEVVRLWRKALARHSQRGHISWQRMRRIADTWLPRPQDHHPWPNVRFDGRTQGRSPVR